MSNSILTNDTLFTTYVKIEDPGVGTNKITLQAPSGLSSNLNLTFPPNNGSSGQILSTDGAGVLTWTSAGSGVSSVSGTTNRITSTGGANPVIDIASTYIGQTSLTTLGTITTGTWNGSLISGTYGGTGINNGSSTITVGGNFSTVGALAIGSAATVNQLFYTSSANNLTGLTNQVNSGLLTNGSGNIAWTTVTGTGAPVLNNTPTLITPNIGAATGTSINLSSTTAATSTSTGSIITLGGAGIAKNIWVGSAFTGSNSTTDGSIINIPSFAYTSSTTNPVNVNVSSVGSVTVNSSSTSTVSTAASCYIDGPPIAGTNTTITNPLALQVNTGNVGMGGDVGVSGYINNVKIPTGLGSNTNIQFSTEDISIPFTVVNSSLIGTGGSGIGQGYSIAMYGDTFVVGSVTDDSNIGAVWVFVKTWTSNGTVTWTQQGSKLVGSSASGASQQGSSVAIYENTIAVGGDRDNSDTGAVWIFTRSGTTWSQQGSKLVGTGASGAARQGISVSLYQDTLVIGGSADSSNVGAAWVFTRSGTTWSQQGSKLVGTGGITGNQRQGCSVSLYENTFVSGGCADDSNIGAMWVFVRSGTIWTQQGSKLVGTGGVGIQNQGFSVSLIKNTFASSGTVDDSNRGAVWIFTRSGTTWIQSGSKISPTASVSQAGNSISLYENTLAIGAQLHNSNNGIVWIYTRTGTTWSLQSSFTSLSNRFGSSVSLGNESSLAVGAYFPGLSENTSTFTKLKNDTLTSNPNLQWTNNNTLSIYGSSVSNANMSSGGNMSSSGTYNSNNFVNSLGNTSNILSIQKSSGSYVQQQSSTILASTSSMVGKGNGCSMFNDSLIGFTSTGGSNVGGVYLYIKTLTSEGTVVYSQQGLPLFGTGATGNVYTSISLQENTVAFADYFDNSSTGASWIFERSGTTWTEQTATKLVGTGSVGSSIQGFSNSLYRDTYIVGGPFDNTNTGATWVFTRSGTTWSQQGSKLVGTGAIGAAKQGNSVSLYENTFVTGGTDDNTSVGAAWVFIRSGTTWSQQGSKLVGTVASGASQQGSSVCIFKNTIAIGGSGDSLNTGAVWIFTRTNNVWTQQGSKLVGTGAVGAARQGGSVSLNENTLISLGRDDNSNVGAVWVFKRSGSTWTQYGSKITITGSTSPSQYINVSLGTESNFIICAGSTAQIGNIFTFWDQQPTTVVSSPNLQWTNNTLSIYGTITYLNSPFLTYRGILSFTGSVLGNNSFRNLCELGIFPYYSDVTRFTPTYGGSGSPYPDFANSGFRIAVDGLYYLTMTNQYEYNGGGGWRYFYISLNNIIVSTDGSIIKVSAMNSTISNTASTYLTCEFMYFFKANDLISVHTIQTSGAGLNMINDQNANVGISIFKVG